MRDLIRFELEGPPGLQELLASAYSDRTRGEYARVMRMWWTWCSSRKAGPPVPATDVQLLTWLSELHEAGHRVSSLRVYAAGVAQMHKLLGHPSPTDSDLVRRMLRGARRRDLELGRKQLLAKPARLETLRSLVAGVPGDGTLAIRNRALLTVLWAAALRRTELVDLTWSDVREDGRGLVLRIWRSKTDQGGEGAFVGILPLQEQAVCPVFHLRAWRAHVKREWPEMLEGGAFVWCPVNRAGALLGHRRLSAHSVWETVRAIAKRVHVDGITPRSFRAGVATELAARKASLPALMRHGRWKNASTVGRYVREIEATDDLNPLWVLREPDKK